MNNILVKFKNILCVLIVLSISTADGYSQVKEYGQIDASDFTAYNPEYNSTMPAVILFKKGESFFYDGEVYQHIHVRIKIINDTGLEYSNVKIPLRSKSLQELVVVRAASYNLDEQNDILIDSLETETIHKVDVSDFYEMSSFAIPNVKAGSIVEYYLVIKVGGMYSLPNWKFHDYLPVEWSEVELHIPPSNVHYKVVLTDTNNIVINDTNEDLFRGEKSMNYRLAKRNLPAIEDLPYLINRDNYVSQVKVQPSSTWYGSYSVWEWEDVVKTMLNNDAIGGQKLNRRLKKKVEELIGEETDPLKKTEIIYAYVVNTVKWNGYYSLYTNQGIREAYRNKKGNVADINLLLIRMLQHAEVNASVALISTRDNGDVITNDPVIEQFNMLIGVVEIGESAFAIDASSGKRSMYAPHPEILYRQAFVIRNDKTYGWLTTQPIEKSQDRVQISLSLKDDGGLQTHVAGVATGLYAESLKATIDELEEPNEYWNEQLQNYTSVSVDTMIFENLDSLTTSVNYSAQLTFNAEDDLSIQGNYIYLKPYLFKKTEKNPFSLENRILPVEYYYPLNESIMVEFEIPDGYELEGMPSSITYKLPLENAYYRFQSNQIGNKMVLMSQLVVKGVLYTSDEYASLKEMYQTMVDTQTAMVVLKKKDAEGEAGSE